MDRFDAGCRRRVLCLAGEQVTAEAAVSQDRGQRRPGPLRLGRRPVGVLVRRPAPVQEELAYARRTSSTTATANSARPEARRSGLRSGRSLRARMASGVPPGASRTIAISQCHRTAAGLAPGWHLGLATARAACLATPTRIRGSHPPCHPARPRPSPGARERAPRPDAAQSAGSHLWSASHPFRRPRRALTHPAPPAMPTTASRSLPTHPSSDSY